MWQNRKCSNKFSCDYQKEILCLCLQRHFVFRDSSLLKKKGGTFSLSERIGFAQVRGFAKDYVNLFVFTQQCHYIACHICIFLLHTFQEILHKFKRSYVCVIVLEVLALRTLYKWEFIRIRVDAVVIFCSMNSANWGHPPVVLLSLVWGCRMNKSWIQQVIKNELGQRFMTLIHSTHSKPSYFPPQNLHAKIHETKIKARF